MFAGFVMSIYVVDHACHHRYMSLTCKMLILLSSALSLLVIDYVLESKSRLCLDIKNLVITSNEIYNDCRLLCSLSIHMHISILIGLK